MISLLAMMLVLWSISTATPPAPSGAASEKGLVPTTGRRPSTGAIEAGALVKPIASRPSIASRRV